MVDAKSLQLAVEAFQNKCLGKMQEVSRGYGRTVLFVSHNMSAIQTLCGRVVYLNQGRVKGIEPMFKSR